jgi:hypothetical protein
MSAPLQRKLRVLRDPLPAAKEMDSQLTLTTEHCIDCDMILARKSINPDATERLMCPQCGEEFVFLPSSSEGELGNPQGQTVR